MTTLSPFTIDMYLSAFPLMAEFFKTDVAQVSITLSSYFVGLASGQLFYGPLMDRFGRKKPLLVGLVIYILASIACGMATSIETLIVLRFVQALGTCAAGVAAFAMVRDLFDPRESAKILSLLVLILSVSPLLAPTIGGYLALYFGWSSLFFTLAMGAIVLGIVIYKFLPESHQGDAGHVLKLGPITKNYYSILKDPRFYTYALSGALGFATLFVYLAASPTIFMEIFGVGEEAYGWIFAIIAMGIIGTSQLNVYLLRKFTNEEILFGALCLLVLVSLTFACCAYKGWFNVSSIVVTIFALLSCVGLSNPNSTSLAMGPFGDRAGSAASMVGFVQMSIGAMASVFVGILKTKELFPLAGIFVVTSILALFVLTFGSKKLGKT